MEDGAPTDLMDHVVNHVVADIKNDTENVTNQSHSTEAGLVLDLIVRLESVTPTSIVQVYILVIARYG